MMNESISQPVDDKKHEDVADHDHKKNDGEPKQAPSDKPKTLEERAKEFLAYVVETAKHTDKRTLLLAKQRLEAKAKEFFRYVVIYMREKAKPDLLMAKGKMEIKAKAFAASVVEMAKKIDKENIVWCKETLQLRSREMILKAVKVAKTTNYRRVLKDKEYQKDLVKRHGRMGVAMMGMFVMATVMFRNDGSDLEFDDGAFRSGVRGRHLSSIDAYPTPKSLEPAEHSLHHKWRLWHDIPKDEQVKALEELVPYFERYGFSLGKQVIPKEKACKFIPKSPNDVCQVPKSDDCSFMSFGIFGDAKFEKNLADSLKCKGFVVDPTESKPTKLNPSVSFQNFGLSKLHEPEGEQPKKVLWNTTLPSLRKFLHEEYTDVLRLDCEGCEIGLMRDILVEDPSFFHHFGQVSVKKHAAKAFVNSEEDLYYFGLMFPMLEEAGHELVTSKVTGCRAKFEKGCMSELNEWGYKCGTGSDGQQKSRSCQNFLFAKEEIAFKEAPAVSAN